MRPLVTKQNTIIWVRTWHKRDGVRDACLRSIEASDIGTQYQLRRQPESCTRRIDFFIDTMREIAAMSGIEYMLHLEDDTLVNKQIMQNLGTWTAVQEPLFGAGWIFVLADMLKDKRRNPEINGHRYHLGPIVPCSAGVLIPTDHVELILAASQHEAPDILISKGVWNMESGRRVFLHDPSLVYVDFDIPTSFDKPQYTGRTHQNFLVDGVVKR